MHIRVTKFKRKAFEFIVLRPEMLGLQAVQKGSGVCVHTRRRQAFRFNYLALFRNPVGKSDVFKQFRSGECECDG